MLEPPKKKKNVRSNYKVLPFESLREVVTFVKSCLLSLFCPLQANVLYKKHGWDVVIMYYHQHAKGDTIMTYGTPGIGSKFFGTTQGEISDSGEMVVKIFNRFIRSKCFPESF